MAGKSQHSTDFSPAVPDDKKEYELGLGVLSIPRLIEAEVTFEQPLLSCFLRCRGEGPTNGSARFLDGTIELD